MRFGSDFHRLSESKTLIAVVANNASRSTFAKVRVTKLDSQKDKTFLSLSITLYAFLIDV